MHLCNVGERLSLHLRYIEQHVSDKFFKADFQQATHWSKRTTQALEEFYQRQYEKTGLVERPIKWLKILNHYRMNVNIGLVCLNFMRKTTKTLDACKQNQLVKSGLFKNGILKLH